MDWCRRVVLMKGFMGSPNPGGHDAIMGAANGSFSVQS